MGPCKKKTKAVIWPIYSWIGDVLEIKEGLAYYDSFRIAFDKNISHDITIGDFVMLESQKSEAYIAQVQVLYENISLGQKWVETQWFYRQNDIPSSAIDRAGVKLCPKDIFSSTHTDLNMVESVVGPCRVRFTAADTIQGLANDEFLCRFKYLNRTKSSGGGVLVHLKKSDLPDGGPGGTGKAVVMTGCGLSSSVRGSTREMMTHDSSSEPSVCKIARVETSRPSSSSSSAYITPRVVYDITRAQARACLRTSKGDPACDGFMNMFRSYHNYVMTSSHKNTRKEILEHLVKVWEGLSANEKTHYIETHHMTDLSPPSSSKFAIRSHKKKIMEGTSVVSSSTSTADISEGAHARASISGGHRMRRRSRVHGGGDIMESDESSGATPYSPAALISMSLGSGGPSDESTNEVMTATIARRAPRDVAQPSRPCVPPDGRRKRKSMASAANRSDKWSDEDYGDNHSGGEEDTEVSSNGRPLRRTSNRENSASGMAGDRRAAGPKRAVSTLSASNSVTSSVPSATTRRSNSRSEDLVSCIWRPSSSPGSAVQRMSATALSAHGHDRGVNEDGNDYEVSHLFEKDKDRSMVNVKTQRNIIDADKSVPSSLSRNCVPRGKTRACPPGGGRKKGNSAASRSDKRSDDSPCDNRSGGGEDAREVDICRTGKYQTVTVGRCSTRSRRGASDAVLSGDNPLRYSPDEHDGIALTDVAVLTSPLGHRTVGVNAPGGFSAASPVVGISDSPAVIAEDVARTEKIVIVCPHCSHDIRAPHSLPGTGEGMYRTTETAHTARALEKNSEDAIGEKTIFSLNESEVDTSDSLPVFAIEGNSRYAKEKYLRQITSYTSSRVGKEYQVAYIPPIGPAAARIAEQSSHVRLSSDRNNHEGLDGNTSLFDEPEISSRRPPSDNAISSKWSERFQHEEVQALCVWSDVAASAAAAKVASDRDIARSYLTQARWLMHTLCREEPNLVWKTRADLSTEWTVDGAFVMMRCNVDAYLLQVLHQHNYNIPKALDQLVSPESVKELFLCWTLAEQLFISNACKQRGVEIGLICRNLSHRSRHAVMDYISRFIYKGDPIDRDHDERNHGSEDATLDQSQMEIDVVQIMSRAQQVLDPWAYAQLWNLFYLHSQLILSDIELGIRIGYTLALSSYLRPEQFASHTDPVATVNIASLDIEKMGGSWHMQIQKAVFVGIAACFPKRIRLKMVTMYDSFFDTY